MNRLPSAGGRNHIVLALCLSLVFPLIYFLTWHQVIDLAPLPYDAAWYLSISERGFVFDGDIFVQSNIGFLPGFALFTSLIAGLTRLDLGHAQFLACVLAFVAGSLMFYQYLRTRIGDTAALLHILLITSNPFTIYFFNGYSESLFFLTLGAFFYCIDAGKLRLAALCVAVGLVTRPQALLLLPLLVLAAIRLERSGAAGQPSSAWAVFCRPANRVSELVLISLLAPMALTAFYFFAFDDTLIYQNVHQAWSYLAPLLTPSEVIAQLFALGLLPIQRLLAGSFPISLHSFELAPLLFFANLIALTLSTRLLCKKNLGMLCLFFWLMAAFGLLTGSAANFGRHTVFFAPLTLLLSMGFAYYLRLSAQQTPAKELPLIRYRSHVLIGLFLAVITFNFVFYAGHQLQGFWVS